MKGIKTRGDLEKSQWPVLWSVNPLNNLQHELLKLYSSDIEEADLLHIKTYLAMYFADKAIREAAAIWQQKGYTNATMDQWLNER